MSALFPELDVYDGRSDPVAHRAPQELEIDRQPTAPPSVDDGSLYAETRARTHLSGLAAGVDSIARFEAAFGLAGQIRALTRTSADSIELVVELPEGLVSASLVGRGHEAWRMGKSFGVSFRGRDVPTPVAKALLRFLARYDGVPFERILAQVVPDPGDEHMLGTDYPESVFYAFAPASGWRRFFEGTELYRGVCGAHTGNVAIVEHTDIECLYNAAPHDDRLPSFFNPPRPSERLRGGDEHPQLAPTLDARHMFTDIRDRDVIRGADKLLDQALESLADDPAPPEMVFVHGGCLPDVTGDDLDASVARTRSKLSLPVVVVGTRNDPMAAALAQLLGGRTFERGRPLEPGGAALLGFPELAGSDEIMRLLERAEIRVLARVLPDLRADELDALARASVLIAYPWDRHRETIDRLGARLAPAKLVRLASPHGRRGTADWLRETAHACGRAEAAGPIIEAALAEIEPTWQRLRARASCYRVGFVIEHGNWQRSLAPERSVGVPMLAMLREMGFAVDILVYRRANTPPPATPDDPSVRVRSYASCEELDALLAAPDVVAWYSELLYERRLTRNGKNPFSLRAFRMGFAGALESFRELLALAELPFYRRYRDYLGEAFEELERGR